MPKGVFVVYSNCTEASRDEEFNRWYTHTHLPDLSKTKGLVKVRRFRNLRSFQGPSQYLTIYEFEGRTLRWKRLPRAGTSIVLEWPECTCLKR